MIIGSPTPVNGLTLTVASNTTITVGAGDCFDLFNVVDLILSVPNTLNSSINGINGLDTGSLGASSLYAVYIIGDQENLQPVGVIASLDLSIPLLPSGYNAYRRIGWAYTDGSSHFIALVQTGNKWSRVYTYPTPPQVLTAGSATSFTNVDLTGTVPVIPNMPVTLAADYTPNVGGNFYSVRPPVSASTLPSQIATDANVVLSSTVKQITSIVSSAPKVAYLVQTGDTLDLYVSQFEDFFTTE